MRERIGVIGGVTLNYHHFDFLTFSYWEDGWNPLFLLDSRTVLAKNRRRLYD